LQNLLDEWGGRVLGLAWKTAQSASDGWTEPLMDFILRLRQQAKSEKNFALADTIRQELSALGIQIQDGKDGTTWSAQ
jgi:cysteinyl-tRNA synthetase